MIVGGHVGFADALHAMTTVGAKPVEVENDSGCVAGDAKVDRDERNSGYSGRSKEVTHMIGGGNARAS